jgi:hypothetical protein
LRTFAFLWFCITSASCMHNFVISQMYVLLKALGNSRTFRSIYIIW